jgi:hypothetical protein
MSDAQPAWTRRQFLGAAAGGLALGAARAGDDPDEQNPPVEATADACILVWLPGGVAQADTWDPKRHTPFRAGMKGSEVLSTFPSIPTSADGLFLSAGLERLAAVMDRGTVVRTVVAPEKFGAVHLKAQHCLMTGYVPPVSVPAPSLGSWVANLRGRRHPSVPAYFDLGRDTEFADAERRLVAAYQGPGFLGIKYAPFVVPNPREGLATLKAVAGMTPERLERRQRLLQGLAGLAPPEVRASPRTAEYLHVVEEARAMMDSPVVRAFELHRESAKTRSAYGSSRFASACLLARRLVEAGARFVEAEYQYGAFKYFDTHEDGHTRLAALKKEIDGPLARLVLDLEERGLLKRTLVVVASEFGRTIAHQPDAGREERGFAEDQTGEGLVIASEKMYGHHGHFSSCSGMLFFGGGFKGGYVHGKTAERHPMAPVEKPARVTDLHASIYRALGISPRAHRVTEERPFYVTKDGKGKPIAELFA